jgi:osmoprotectant transport system permease protein
MSSGLADQLEKLPGLFGAHVSLTGIALAIGVFVALPLAIFIAKSPRLRLPVLAAAGVIQTVPSLALLALMVPLLGAFGLYPALVALVLYSMLPVLRNTVVGIEGVPKDAVEAALAMGMTGSQILRLVELPLALPVILAGVRTAAVWVVGTATLSTPVGQPSLGNLIFAGLHTRNWASVLLGCAAAALLAIVLDALIGGLEIAAAKRSRARAHVSTIGLLLLFGGSPILPHVLAPAATVASKSEAKSAAPAPAREDTAFVIGSKTFTEQYILADLIESRLRAANLPVSRADSLGSSIAFDALVQGQIDVYVDYSGTLWANAMKRTDTLPAWQVSALLAAWLFEKHGIRALGNLGFENAYALAMRRDRAEAIGVKTIGDLAPHAPKFRFGGDYEFLERPEWTRLKETYGLSFRELVSFDSTFMYEAVNSGEVEVIAAFSSDGRIAAYDLVVLEDTAPAFPPYDAVLLLSKRAANDSSVVRALEPLIGAIPVDRMRRANLMVDRERDKKTPKEAASWLAEAVH